MGGGFAVTERSAEPGQGQHGQSDAALPNQLAMVGGYVPGTIICGVFDPPAMFRSRTVDSRVNRQLPT